MWSTLTLLLVNYILKARKQQEEGKEPTPIGQELVVLEDTLKKLLFYLNDIGVYVAKVLVTNSIDKKLIPFRKER